MEGCKASIKLCLCHTLLLYDYDYHHGFLCFDEVRVTEKNIALVKHNQITMYMYIYIYEYTFTRFSKTKQRRGFVWFLARLDAVNQT